MIARRDRELVESVAAAWLAELRRERPDVVWTIEEEGTGRVVASSLPGQVDRGHAAPADLDTGLEGFVPGRTAADEDGVDS